MVPTSFNPAAAAEVLKEQQESIKEVLDNCAKVVQARGGCSVPYTLEGESLRGRVRKRQGEIDAYLTDYIKYYEDLLDHAAQPVLPALGWDKLLTEQLPAIVSNTVNFNLKKVGLGVATAMQQISPVLPAPVEGGLVERHHGARTRANAGLQALDAKGSNFAKILENWRELGANVADARNHATHEMTAHEFVDSFLVLREDDYATLYWNRLTFQLLHVLSSTPNLGAEERDREVEIDGFPKIPAAAAGARVA